MTHDAKSQKGHFTPAGVHKCRVKYIELLEKRRESTPTTWDSDFTL